MKLFKAKLKRIYVVYLTRFIIDCKRMTRRHTLSSQYIVWINYLKHFIGFWEVRYFQRGFQAQTIGGKMKTDKILRDIQIKLIELANEIQKQRELRFKKQLPATKEKRDKALLETSIKLSHVFSELGYTNESK